MEHDKRWLETVWSLIDDSTEQEDPRLEKAGLNDAIEQLTRALRDVEDAWMWYALGYAYYMHPDRIGSVEIQQHTVEALRRSIAIDSHFQLARLYLAHHFYDLGNYGSAYRELKQGDPCDLYPYISLKWSELELCCSIMLRGLVNCINAIDAFIEEVRRHPIEDVAPFNLANALARSVHNPDVNMPCRIIEQMRELDRLGRSDGWLAKIVEEGKGHH